MKALLHKQGFHIFAKTKKPVYFRKQAFVGGREGSRTPNLLIRSQMLYPVELRDHFSVLVMQSNGNFSYNASPKHTFF